MRCTTLKLIVAMFAALAGLDLSSAQAGGASHYDCAHGGTKSFFDIAVDPSCVPLLSDPGWVDLKSNADLVVSYLPSSVLRDGDAVQVPVQFDFAAPATMQDLKYDHVRAKYEFFCSSHRQLLMEGTYKLGQDTIFTREQDMPATEAVEPGTISAEVFRIVCSGNGGSGDAMHPTTFGFDGAFVCPEALPDDNARVENVTAFLKWMDATYSPVTPADIASARTDLLTRHHCAETLDKLHPAL